MLDGRCGRCSCLQGVSPEVPCALAGAGMCRMPAPSARARKPRLLVCTAARLWALQWHRHQPQCSPGLLRNLVSHPAHGSKEKLLGGSLWGSQNSPFSPEKTWGWQHPPRPALHHSSAPQGSWSAWSWLSASLWLLLSSTAPGMDPSSSTACCSVAFLSRPPPTPCMCWEVFSLWPVRGCSPFDIPHTPRKQQEHDIQTSSSWLGCPMNWAACKGGAKADCGFREQPLALEDSRLGNGDCRTLRTSTQSPTPPPARGGPGSERPT